jgi:hypothetical protein
MNMNDVVLQIWRSETGDFAGRILRDGVEDRRISGCACRDGVEYKVLEAGIEFDRVEVLNATPLVLS